MQGMEQTRFESHHALTRLPYFERLEPGWLRLDPALGPAIDVHTHLALAFLGPMRVDLNRAYPRTEHYLGMDHPVDLDVYANRNFTPDDLRRMKLDLILLSMTSRGMRRTHTLPNLLREMRALSIAHCVLLPIDLPLISDNAGAYLTVSRGHAEVVCFGSVHPFSRGLAARLDRQRAMGARGIKFHPASQMIAPDHPRAMTLYRLCAERHLPVLFHCGPVDIEPAAGRRRSQVRLYEPAIANNPDTTFVLGHSGALQFDLALDLARRYDNVWLESSSQSLTNVRRLVADGPPRRVLFGSDWPFYSQAMSLAKVLLATESAPDARRAMMFDNAARLFGLA